MFELNPKIQRVPTSGLSDFCWWCENPFEGTTPTGEPCTALEIADFQEVGVTIYMHEECFKRRKAREELLPVYLQADRAYAEAEAHLVVLIEAAAKSGMASDQRAANEFRHDAYLDATKGALIAAHRLIGALGYGA